MKCKKIISILLTFVFVTTFASFTSVNAASVSLNLPSSVTAGETITATISGTAEQWNLTLSANGTTIATSSDTSNVGSEISISKTGTYTTTEAGTVTFKLTGDYSYTASDGSIITEDVNTTKTVTVNAKAEETPAPSTSGNTGETTTPTTPTPTTPTEPTFTSVNLTMYSTGNINLRSSWSTSSSAVAIQKGTELNITGTSTEKINGYVWYRVNYNGATKYVASNLLTNTKPEDQKEEEKSNNANLKSLTIDGYELTPKFSVNVVSYSLEIGNDVNELSIKAEAEDSKASVNVQGNKNLKVGDNLVTISVSAEDGTTKKYEVNVSKIDEVKFGLKTLKIKDTDIEKKFKTDVYEYEIDIKDIDKLEIEVEATVADAIIEILGNENLQNGENLITIMVKSADGAENATYQITVNKNAKELVDVLATNDMEPIDTKIILYGGICLLALILLIILIVVLIRNKVKNKDEETFKEEEEKKLYNFDKSNFKNEFSNDFNNEMEDEKEEIIEKGLQDKYEEDKVKNDIFQKSDEYQDDNEEITDDEEENLEQEIENMIKDKKNKKGKGKHF